MTDLRVLAGSSTAEEIAAVVVVLGGLPRPAARPAVRPAGTAAGATPAWLRAARQEAVGARPRATPGDLHRQD